MKIEIMAELFEAAYQQELGLIVETNNPQRMDTYLEEYKRAMPRYKDILICIPSIPNHLFLTKKTVELDS